MYNHVYEYIALQLYTTSTRVSSLKASEGSSQEAIFLRLRQKNGGVSEVSRPRSGPCVGTFKGMLRPPDQVDGCVKSSPLCAPDVGLCAAQARNRPSWVPRWDVMMGRRRQPATRARERGAQAAGVHSKRSTAVQFRV